MPLDVAALAAFLAIALALTLLLTRELLYPPVIQIGVWLVTLIVYLMQQGRYVAIAPEVEGLILAAVLAYSFGAFAIWVLFSRELPHSTQAMQRGFNLAPLDQKRYALFLLASLVGLLGAFIFVRTSISIARAGSTDNLLINLRRAVTDPNVAKPAALALAGYALPLIYALAGYGLIYFRVHKDRRVLLLTLALSLAALTVGFFSTGRGIVLFFILEMAVIYTLTSKKLNVKALIGGLLAFFAIFYVGALLLAKGGIDSDSSIVENLASLFDSLSLYLLSGISALSVAFPTMNVDGGGASIFRTIYAILRAVGFDVDVVPLIQPFVRVPALTNVYTSFLPYLRDYGVLGLVLAQFAFGMLQTGLFVLFLQKRSPFYLFLVAVSTFATLTQPFTDSYMSLLSTWVQYAIYAVLLSQFVFRASASVEQEIEVPESPKPRRRLFYWS